MADAIRFGDSRIGPAFLDDYAAGTRAIGEMAAMLEQIATTPAPLAPSWLVITVGRDVAHGLAPLFAPIEQI